PYRSAAQCATTQIDTLSLHDALPIYLIGCRLAAERFGIIHQTVPSSSAPLRQQGEFSLPLLEPLNRQETVARAKYSSGTTLVARSEEHMSELQSRENLVCRLLLEKKK